MILTHDVADEDRVRFEHVMGLLRWNIDKRGRSSTDDPFRCIIDEAEAVAILNTCDAMTKRIAELEAYQFVMAECADSHAHNEMHAMEHIEELEAALEGLLNHTKNNQQICGLNDRARAALEHSKGARR